MENILPYAGMVLRDNTNLPKDVILYILQLSKRIVLPNRNISYSLTHFDNKRGRYWNKLITYYDCPECSIFKRQMIEEYPRRTCIIIEACRSQRYKYNYNSIHVKVYTHYPSVLNKKRNKMIEKCLLLKYY